MVDGAGFAPVGWFQSFEFETELALLGLAAVALLVAVALEKAPKLD